MFNKKLMLIFTLIVLLSLSTVSADDDLTELNVCDNGLNDETINLDESNNVDESDILDKSDVMDESDILDESIDDDFDESIISDSDEIEKSDVFIDEDAVLKYENSDDIEPYAELANLLAGSPDGSTVALPNNYMYGIGPDDEQFMDGIEIRSLIIDGQNHFINGVGLARIFNVTGENVVLKNIAFLNGYSRDEGGAIYFAGENLTIINCTFENNFAYVGGAVYANNSAVFENSRFIDNSALYYGGAIYVGNFTSITECTFDGNDADRGASVFILTPFIPDPEPDPDIDPDVDPDIDPDADPDVDPDSDPDDGGDDDYDPDAFPDDDPDTDDEWDPASIIIDSIFINSHGFTRGALFLGGNVLIQINGTVFENMSAEYAPAIYATNFCFMDVNDCSFKNLHAEKTGGAVAFIDNIGATLRNCIFENTTSSKNGGAIFHDANSWGFAAPVSLKIFNSNFTNCSSGFGGAVAHIASTLRIVNSSFTDNYATFDGGAVYSSRAYDIYLYDSNFTNNKLNFSSGEGLSSGGALFASYAQLLSINNTYFINNSNQAAYVYESRLRLNHTYFENNDEAVRFVCKWDMQIGENDFNTDKFIELDYDPFFSLISVGEGIELELINNSIDVDSIPVYFNSVEWGWVSPVKNQGFSGACWCFSTISAIESGLLKSTGVLYDFSEQNMQKLLLQYSKYGHVQFVEGGETTTAIMYALSWLGPIDEEEDTFDMLAKFTRLIDAKKIHVQDVILIPPRDVSYDIDYIKQAILKCGSVTTDFYSLEEEPNFNIETSAFYYNESDVLYPNHAVAIVGWDDNYPAENFISTPPGDGAWIIKNSYGKGEYDNGFCYISYYDTVIFKESCGLGVLFENTENYNKNYQTGFGGQVDIISEVESYSYSNSYQAIDDDYISAIGTYFNGAGEDYSFEIYVNGVLKLSQDGIAPFYGYHTVKLNTQIPIKKGDNFKVVMKTHSAPLLSLGTMRFKANVSYIDEGNGWEDLSFGNCTVVLRVYTLDKQREDAESRVASQIIANNMTVTAAESGKGIFEISLKTIEGKALAYNQFEVLFNNQIIKLTTDVNGIAKFEFDLNKKGKYPINIAYLGDKDYKGALAIASITINPIKTSLISKAKTFLATKKTKYFTAKLKASNGKALAKKTIAFTVNGKTYNAKTNKNGIAKVKLPLAAAKSYTLNIKFAGDNVYIASSKSVKVKIIKEKTKVTAPKKTFKKNKKVKKVVVKLKNSKGKAICKKNLTLIVNKEKYTAKTNKKGKATFKVTLTKTGTKKYTVKFAGDKQYKACKKAGKISIK